MAGKRHKVIDEFVSSLEKECDDGGKDVNVEKLKEVINKIDRALATWVVPWFVQKLLQEIKKEIEDVISRVR